MSRMSILPPYYFYICGMYTCVHDLTYTSLVLDPMADLSLNMAVERQLHPALPLELWKTLHL